MWLMRRSPAIARRDDDTVITAPSNAGHREALTFVLASRTFRNRKPLATEPDMSKLYTPQFLPEAS